MKFIFSYERLLQFYHQQEEVARRDHMESTAQLESEKTKYQKMWDLHDGAIGDIYELRKNLNGAPVAKLEQLDQFID